ncbi:hypothetical protein AM387_24915 [Klebsiella pneumoniae]|uniref:hypothetical protein n=1 Tax=Klebsiella pneumoniae TaxID=573 RepID=UPI00081C9C18|nr:hypothetical protein [Klebsiella pneumoniae]EIV2088587.1 hypothetical protein [Klebsiella pneumoniae subsp. ozaenae]HDS7832872.1 hypothetical protein [Klebsiella pneumoniae subsp. pneumoniae]AOA95132.1 hypothetical protein A8C02_06935 [Klebsiella pneumoniae]AWC96937.1 hypothetical protein AM388_04425 [Klebsiella pneumoniae]AWD94656.1 hypothetical protein AM389_04685 [Klebsiella pneumoniae]
MTGSDARQADVLFKAIVDYYGNMSGSDITTSQVNQRDKIIASGVIECDASLDSQILSLQNELIEADNALTTEEMYARRKSVIETAINLIG